MKSWPPVWPMAKLFLGQQTHNNLSPSLFFPSASLAFLAQNQLTPACLSRFSSLARSLALPLSHTHSRWTATAVTVYEVNFFFFFYLSCLCFACSTASQPLATFSVTHTRPRAPSNASLRCPVCILSSELTLLDHVTTRLKSTSRDISTTRFKLKKWHKFFWVWRDCPAFFLLLLHHLGSVAFSPSHLLYYMSVASSPVSSSSPSGTQ